MQIEQPECECGCGGVPNKKSNGEFYRFIKGHGTKGKKLSEEFKKNLSEKAKGRRLSKETREKISKAGKGRKHSQETLKKMLESAHKGKDHWNWNNGIMEGKNGRVFVRKASKEYIARARLIMEQHLGRQLLSSEIVHHIDGDPSNDSVENLVITNRKNHIAGHNTGKTHSEETKRKIGLKSKDRKWTENARVQILKSLIGRKHSEETKRKMSEATTKYWERKRNEDK